MVPGEFRWGIGRDFLSELKDGSSEDVDYSVLSIFWEKDRKVLFAGGKIGWVSRKSVALAPEVPERPRNEGRRVRAGDIGIGSQEIVGSIIPISSGRRSSIEEEGSGVGVGAEARRCWYLSCSHCCSLAQLCS